MTSSDKPYLASKKAMSTLLGVVSTLIALGAAVVVAIKAPEATWFGGVAIMAVVAIGGACGYHVHRQGRIDENTAPNGAPGPG